MLALLALTATFGLVPPLPDWRLPFPAPVPATQTLSPDGLPPVDTPLQPGGAAGTPTPIDGQVSAPTLRIATYNLEHAFSPATFERWRAWCAPRDWRDDGTPRPEGLSWCNALNGRDMGGRRIGAAVHNAQAHRAKLQAIAAGIGATRADILLLQEVADAETLQAVLGHGYRHAITRQPGSTQQVAIAWRTDRGLQVALREVPELAQAVPGGGRTRAGLAIDVQLPAPHPRVPLTILNVHLKAGCRQGRMDQSASRSPTRRARRETACTLLQQQAGLLADWVRAEQAAGRRVMVAGDFNRDLRNERRTGWPAHLPPSSAPVSLLAALDAGLDHPLTLVPTPRYPGTVRCHRHIDAFVLTPDWTAVLATPLSALQSEVLAADAPDALATVRASDHCPLVLALPLRRPPTSGLIVP